jgi:uncharacterized protein DUF4340
VKLRNPLIALGALAGLAAYVYIVEIRGSEKKQREKEASEKVFSLKAQDVTGFTLTHGGERVRLEKAGGQWRIHEPIPADPDSDGVDRLVRSLEDLKITHDLGKQTDLEGYHLKNPAVRLEIQATSKTPPPSLALGDDAPTGGGTYARLGEADKVLVVSGASSIQGASFYSLRDKSFFKLDPSKLTSCRIQRGKEEIDLARSDGKWNLSRPVAAPADDPSVTDLLFALQRLTVSEFLEESPAAASLAGRGLAPPETRVILSGDEWKGDKTLVFGKSENGGLYALHPVSGALVRVPDGISAKLKSTVSDLRRKDILPIPRFEIARLRWTGAGLPSLELERQDDNRWKRISPAPGILKEDPVDLLLRNLSDLKADTFTDNPGKDLGRYGLSHPAVKIELWKKDPAKGEPAVVEVGSPGNAGKIPMRDPAWPAVSLVTASTWETAKKQAAMVAVEPIEPPQSQTAPSKGSKPSASKRPSSP